TKENIKARAMARKGKLDELDRSFDYKFWQAQSATARFAAAHQWKKAGELKTYWIFNGFWRPKPDFTLEPMCLSEKLLAEVV
ncbi:MAG: hypothetical protein IT291_09535, partial [Deltaproteobacteria bacterium]|nr:hypothetical protein [Deltaproteobacteria bacterium]